MKKACLPYKECTAVGWYHDTFSKCFVWENCDFNNLEVDVPFYTLKRGKFKNCFSNRNCYIHKLNLQPENLIFSNEKRSLLGVKGDCTVIKKNETHLEFSEIACNSEAYFICEVGKSTNYL